MPKTMGIELENELKTHFLQKRGRQLGEYAEHLEDTSMWTAKGKGNGNFVHMIKAI